MLGEKFGVSRSRRRTVSKFQFFPFAVPSFVFFLFGWWWTVNPVSRSVTMQRQMAATAMGTLASQMKPGTWAELSTNGFVVNGVSILVPLDQGCSLIDYITQYADSASWDPISRQFMFVGTTHGICTGGRFVIYSDSSNTWRVGPLPPSGATGLVHAYDHNTVNPLTGDAFYRVFLSENIWKYSTNGAGTWSLLPPVPESVIRTFGSGGAAVEYFPELGGLVFVSGGMPAGGSFGTGGGAVGFFDAATSQWRQLANSLPMGNASNFIEYNPVHKVVVFGGGGSSEVYKLDRFGNITRMRNAPICLGIQQSSISVDPVSGKYLVIGAAGQFYEYDVITDTWSLLPNGTPFTPITGWGLIDGVIQAPVSTYGVIMYVVYNSTNSKVYLYKHAGGGGKSR